MIVFTKKARFSRAFCILLNSRSPAMVKMDKFKQSSTMLLLMDSSRIKALKERYMTLSIKKLTLIAFLGALVACGGGDDTAAAAAEEAVAEETGTDEVIIETASDVVTTLADVNGFNIVANIRNPRTDFYGTEVEVTAFVKDHSNNWVDDGTVVTFVADDHGGIPNQCATIAGRCSVTWVSAGDRSVGHSGIPVDRSDDYYVTIMGRTIGEDSFIDKDGDSKFDVNEVFMTQSEPFLDANDDGVYNPEIDEFDERMDFNGNGLFDETFTKFRGESCSDAAVAAGHCASKVEVWSTAVLVASVAGEVNIDFNDCSGTSLTAINVVSSSTYCITLTDRNGNTPPIGTKFTATVDILEVEIEPKGEVPDTGDYDGFDTGIRLKAKLGDGETTGTLILKATSVDEIDTYLTIDASDPS
jgi:hypothetical protein